METVLTSDASLVAFPEKTVFRLSGRDPAGMLNAILTNDVPKDTNTGAYALLLNPKGRIQTDLLVVKDGEDLLVVTEREGAEAARETLGRYAPFSRVKLEETDMEVLGVHGPRAGKLLGLDLSEHESAEIEVGGTLVLAVGTAVPARGFDVLLSPDALSAVREYLLERGVLPVGPEAYEVVRIAAGVPRFGVDITPENFPGESEGLLSRTVSFEKGCYPGQETVARMHYRGRPNKKLYRFELVPGSMESPEAGDEVLQSEKKLVGPVSTVDVVGWLSSVSPLSADGRVHALGYLSRKADLGAPMRAEDASISALGPA